MIIQKEIRNLIREIAEEEGKPFEEVREIVYSQFKFLKGVMESAEKDDKDSYKNVQLRHLGTFHASSAKIDFLRKKFEDGKE